MTKGTSAPPGDSATELARHILTLPHPMNTMQKKWCQTPEQGDPERLAPCP